MARRGWLFHTTLGNFLGTGKGFSYGSAEPGRGSGQYCSGFLWGEPSHFSWIIRLLVASVICIVAVIVCFPISMLLPVNCSSLNTWSLPSMPPILSCLVQGSMRGRSEKWCVVWSSFSGNTKLENTIPKQQYVSPKRKPVLFYHIIGTKKSRQLRGSNRNKSFLWNNQKV